MSVGPPLQPAPLDRRRHAYRDDVAASSLKEQVLAERYVDGVAHQVIVAAAPLRVRPDPSAGLDSELLFGERFVVYEECEGWAWGQAARDGYVGYVPVADLSHSIFATTHKVTGLATHLYPVADIKAPPLMSLPMGAELEIVDVTAPLCRHAGGGFVPSCHIASLAYQEADFVAVAERFIGTPYLWGGRTHAGIDCSGLVQVSLQAAGVATPRDSDMQREEMGEALAFAEDLSGLRRGDLIFWKGHVGIMQDASTLLHANAHHMSVHAEPLAKVVARSSATGSNIVSIRRLTALVA